MTRVPYASIMGNLMYIMMCTRPNLVQNINMVSMYVSILGKEYWQVMKRILRYVKGTKYIRLIFKGDS